MNKNTALKTIKEAAFETLGCTEPAAIGLCVATAKKHLSDDIEKIILTLDKNVLKNSSAVGIYGTDKKGIKFAVALSLLKKPDKGLSIFDNTEKQDILKAEKFLSEKQIEVNNKKDISHLFIKAELFTKKEKAVCIIEKSHSNICLIQVNDQKIFEKKILKQKTTKPNKIEDISIKDLIDIIEEINDHEIEYLKDYVNINLKAADLAKKLKSPMALSIEKLFSETSTSLTSIIYSIKNTATLASLARMTGEKVPIIGCTGSGNHGITFFISIGQCYKLLPFEKKKSLEKALAFGLLTLVYIKSNTGLLTPMCGCSVAAAAASAAAIAYLLGLNQDQILASINFVLANLSGLICDGAKSSCALKISTSVMIAIESALLAKENQKICGEGITANSLKDTLKNLSKLHEMGMEKMDETILDIFSKKTCL
ncbi:MAG: serine dehydratase subunit alpha family protein [Parachlamydiales bacterium]|nr:serine dehydratase subunit alpha family protein [Parachlamydiales bacterium]